VLDFRRPSAVPNYLDGRWQRRLLIYLGLAGLAALALAWTADPALFSGPQALAPPAGSRPPLTARLGAQAAPSDADHARSKPGARFPGVRDDYLGEVRDDTVFRGAEKDAWFHLLAILDQTSAQELEQASEGQVGYLQLDQQPASYRGRLVTISGIVRSAKQIAAPENSYGIDDYYQLWLQPDRSAADLVVVYCLDVPQGFPLGGELDVPGAITGFFFKRWVYQARGGILTAPLILARTVDWQPPPAASPATPGEPSAQLLVFAALLALVVFGALIAFTRQRRTHRLPEPAAIAEAIGSLETQIEADAGIETPTRHAGDTGEQR
jgi:hypothetical protein